MGFCLIVEIFFIYLFFFKCLVFFEKDYFEEVRILFGKVCVIYVVWVNYNNKGCYGVVNDLDMFIFS